MTGPILYTAELDLADADIPPFRDWFAGRHASDLYEAGLKVCTCYRAVEGGMSIIDIYEADDWAVFNGPAYVGIRPRDPYGPEILERRRNKSHTVYANDQGAIARGPFRADFVSLARFEAPAEAEAKLRAALGGAAPLAQRVRLVARTTDHPRNPTFRPRLMLLAEWNDRPPSAAALDEWVTAQLGAAPESLDHFVGQRIYPWPDRR